MHVDFRFNKAGQGCFYTGFFNHNNSAYALAYDCGTHSNQKYLKREISKFKEKLNLHNNNTLNALIISHFDEDHVNYVSTLLSGLKKCDRVILPYLTPSERFVLYLKQRAGGSAESADYQQFLIDPVGYLQEFNVGEIMFIGNGEDEESIAFDDDSFGPDGKSAHLGNEFYVREFSSFTVDVSMIRSTSLSPPAEYLAELEANPNSIGFYRDRTKMYIYPFWQFYFYNQPRSSNHNAQISDFSLEVNNYFYINAISIAPLNQLNLKFLFDNWKTFAEIYKDNFNQRSLNFSSLIVQHSSLLKNNRISSGKKLVNRKKHATLLMGDIPLKGLRLPKAIELDQIRFFQYPHHGAHTHWDKSIPHALSNKVTAIFNFGFGNTYGHPSAITLSRLVGAYKWDIRYNHQLKSFRYSIHNTTY
ncbi:hypothetical protein SAMN04488511_101151 [Pedobacter suwonensis]|uniref:Metallo-beta-lactamase superfamily protein n=1 Tax=Pedobacter suwonensis TaxID=332999 RepID=A0A1I0SFF6_9SPHI|nr:hypothetical protein [Pedobacter suwonensis]SFA38230.1 hypothetical protein SAMN04488511_101151 [Pedobacter suwonensis]